MKLTRIDQVKRNWRSEVEYNYNGNARQIKMSDSVLKYLQSEKLLEPIVYCCGKSVGNCLIVGIGIDYIIFNVHPDSVTNRFTLELRKEMTE